MGENTINAQGRLSRRDFIKISAVAGVSLLAAGSPFVGRAAGPSGRKMRFANVGTGSRSKMYQTAILKDYKDTCEMVGYCDTNLGRLQVAQKFAKAAGVDVPIFEAKDFDKMVKQTKPDAVIVTCVDAYHHEYIVRAMELGVDVITEKPITNQVKKLQAIVDARKKTGKNVRVTFNYRYSPPRTQVKDLLMKGVIGDILSVDFHWMLNTFHGADYFRRWHSQKKISNGLMVHKATHHFDLVNWWLSAMPVSVYATGKREFYTPKMIKRFGLEGPHERCLTCPEKQKCAFQLDLAANPGLKELYLDNEKYDGYFRDRCIFRPDIDIEDTMNVLVRYSNNATLAYSLNAFNAWEGYYIIFNGTKGRLEHKMEEKVYINGDGSVPGALKADGTYIRIYPLRGPGYEVDVWTGEGGHGGGDKVMLDDLFAAEKKPDQYMRASDERGGAYSALTGIAANIAFKTGQPVEVGELIKGLKLPDFPAMPNHDDPLPMPERSVPGEA